MNTSWPGMGAVCAVVLAATGGEVTGHALVVEIGPAAGDRPAGRPAPVMIVGEPVLVPTREHGFGDRAAPPGILAPEVAGTWPGAAFANETAWQVRPVTFQPRPPARRFFLIPEPGLPLMLLAAFALWRRRWRY